jgi:substrate-binding family protein
VARTAVVTAAAVTTRKWAVVPSSTAAASAPHGRPQRPAKAVHGVEAGQDRALVAVLDQHPGLICQYDVEGDERLAAVVERGLPMVVVDGPPRPGAGHVGVDDHRGGVLAAGHLLELGHRRLGVVAAGLSPDRYEGLAGLQRQVGARYRVIRERLAGYRAAAEAAGLDWAAVPVQERCPYGQDASRRAAIALLDQPDRPTALLALSDELASAAPRAAEELGIAVPGELSLVGLDDTPPAALTRLTTIHQPHGDKGERRRPDGCWTRTASRPARSCRSSWSSAPRPPHRRLEAARVGEFEHLSKWYGKHKCGWSTNQRR